MNFPETGDALKEFAEAKYGENAKIIVGMSVHTLLMSRLACAPSLADRLSFGKETIKIVVEIIKDLRPDLPWDDLAIEIQKCTKELASK
jgi:hypothetical protein